ncbi:MAG: hypothetical protein JXP73_00680 [Deltaproteobacteria bacterium]|jgi:hypothetical protein|nr:hypothetical protein [Deltaproteobacteria bacterium]
MCGIRQSPVGRWGRVWLHGFIVLALLSLLQPLAAGETRQAAEPAKSAGAVPDGSAARSAGEAAQAPGEDHKAKKKIPRKLLRRLLGCWQLDGQERWIISRLDANGAQVVTKLLKRTAHPTLPDQANRVAVPSTLMYDARQGNFGFATAARLHPALVMFKASGSTLEASFYAKRTPKDRYAPTGHTATLQRCKARVRPRSSRARPTSPPRLD